MSTTGGWSPAAAAVLPALQSLPRDEPHRLGQLLLDCGGEGDPPEGDEAIEADLLRRSEDLRTGRVSGVPGDVVFRRAREQFR